MRTHRLGRIVVIAMLAIGGLFGGRGGWRLPAPALAATHQTLYAVTTITTGLQIYSADPIALNDNEQVVFTEIDAVNPNVVTSAAYWSDGAVTTLVTPTCAKCPPSAYADAINDRGVVAGTTNVTDQDGYNRAFVESITNRRPRLLPILGGTLDSYEEVPMAINNAGDVVGISPTSTGSEHGFLWNGSSITDLGDLGGENSSADWISPNGLIVGCADMPDGIHHHPTIYQAGQMQDMGLPAGTTDGCAYAINDAGQVIGFASDYLSPTSCVPWLWQNGTFADLPTVQNTCFNPVSLNDAGEIVGYIDYQPVPDQAGYQIPVVFQAGAPSELSQTQTPFDSAAAEDTAGTTWYGMPTAVNRYGAFVIIGPGPNAAGGTYATALLFTPIHVYDDTNSAITYSGAWARLSLKGAYHGYVSQATDGSSATLTFTGKSVSVIGAASPTLGSAQLLIDGQPNQTVSETGAAAVRQRLCTIYFPTRGSHTITITPRGPFDLDAITVAPH